MRGLQELHKPLWETLRSVWESLWSLWERLGWEQPFSQASHKHFLAERLGMVPARSAAIGYWDI